MLDKDNKNNNNSIRKMVFAGICLSLCMVLPFLTGQIPQVAKMISPMHIPVFLAGYLCGPIWGLGVGFIAPLLRSMLFGMPVLMPNATAMAFELAGYGLFSGLFFMIFPKKNVFVYVSLVLAMLIGRILYGIAMFAIMGITGNEYSFAMFFAAAFTNAIPAIIIHIVLIPILVFALKKAKLLYYQ